MSPLGDEDSKTDKLSELGDEDVDEEHSPEPVVARRAPARCGELGGVARPADPDRLDPDVDPESDDGEDDRDGREGGMPAEERVGDDGGGYLQGRQRAERERARARHDE